VNLILTILLEYVVRKARGDEGFVGGEEPGEDEAGVPGKVGGKPVKTPVLGCYQPGRFQTELPDRQAEEGS